MLSLLTALIVWPLLRVAKAADRAQSLPRGLAEPATGVPSPQGLGYSGVVLQRLVEHARTVLGVHRAWITAGASADEPHYTVAAAGIDADMIGRRPSDGAINGLHPLASTPVVAGGRVRATFCVAGPVGDRELEGRDLALLAELAAMTGEVLHHHASHELAAGDSSAEIRALVQALAEADGDTYRHSLEVAATARAVGDLLGLDGVDLVEVELGALLHDVGKLRLPPRILSKPGPLDTQERELMNLHPEWGASLVAGVPGLEAVALVVRLHHERLDGAGYPHGLPAERIPMASRIVSVCDAYGAMTRRRDYREPLEMDAALEELELNAGTQFDPLVVEVLGSFVREPVPMAA